jgi:hypothetical protein
MKMDLVLGLWLAWIFFLACMVLMNSSLLMKGLIMVVLALSIHDAYKYHKQKQELDDDDEY